MGQGCGSYFLWLVNLFLFNFSEQGDNEEKALQTSGRQRDTSELAEAGIWDGRGIISKRLS